MLKLMYITNQPEVAVIAENAGVDRIFVDMEYIGKSDRQGGMDTVQCRHTLADVSAIRKAITKAELLVRCNPIHDATVAYTSSETEIDGIIAHGADIIMLPFFKTVDEVKRFIQCVKGRARTMLLLETPEAAERVDEILNVPGIDEVHIGLNDLSLGYGKKFMFQLLTDGTVEELCYKARKKRIPYGFGGVASIGKGMLPAEKIIREHYRLGSSFVILSRSFCNADEIAEIEEIKRIFAEGIKEIREVENECQRYANFFRENQREIANIVKRISE